MKQFHKKNAPARPEPTAEQKAGSTRVLKNGAYATVITVIVLVAVILINLIMGALPTKYTEFDISSSGLFTLSDTTKTMLAALDKDVTAYYLAETGNEDSNITRILDRYAGESSHFTWQQRDPALFPTFAQQYDAENASSSSVILVCGDKSAVVDYYDMYKADYSSYYTTGSYSLNFSAESALTSGISRVTSDSSYVLYQLTGHGETDLSSDFTETLENSNISVEDLNLLSAGSIPQDASVLLINAPQVDYTSDTIDLLRAYLQNGGKLLVATGLEYDTPNLDALLAEYGMTRQTGLVIESDPNYFAYRYPSTYLLPTVVSNDVTSGMTDGMMVFTPVAQGILTDTDNEDITYTNLLSTSTSSYAMQDYATAETASQGANDPNGPFYPAVAAESASTGAQVVWVNCANIFVSEIDQMVSGGNSQFLGSIINWFNGEDNAVVIDAKSMNATSLTVPSTAVTGLGLLFVIVLPVACIVIGVVVFILRRRR